VSTNSSKVTGSATGALLSEASTNTYKSRKVIDAATASSYRLVASAKTSKATDSINQSGSSFQQSNN
jgi:hypothetical protein